MDSGFRRNDENRTSRTFYETVLHIIPLKSYENRVIRVQTGGEPIDPVNGIIALQLRAKRLGGVNYRPHNKERK
jgi:hypothetical protein